MGPLTLDEIQTQLRSGSFTGEFEALEATGQSEGELQWSKEWIPLAKLLAPVVSEQPVRATQASPRAVARDAARGQTSYSAMRESVSLFAMLSVIALVVLGAAYVLMGIKSRGLIAIILGGVIAVFGSFLAIAVKHALLLLADISDALMEQNRHRKKDGMNKP